MEYVLNEGRPDERMIEADNYGYQADNQLVTFWKDVSGQAVAIFTCPVRNVISIEAKPKV